MTRIHAGDSDSRKALADVRTASQGALIQARVERSGAPIETAADELARMLEVDRGA